MCAHEILRDWVKSVHWARFCFSFWIHVYMAQETTPPFCFTGGGVRGDVTERMPSGFLHPSVWIPSYCTANPSHADGPELADPIALDRSHHLLVCPLKMTSFDHLDVLSSRWLLVSHSSVGPGASKMLTIMPALNTKFPANNVKHCTKSLLQ